MSGWWFTVRYRDVSSGQESIVGMRNISSSSGTDGMQSFVALIGGLEPYRKYRIKVYTATQDGIESCEQEPVTALTGEHTLCTSAQL